MIVARFPRVVMPSPRRRHGAGSDVCGRFVKRPYDENPCFYVQGRISSTRGSGAASNKRDVEDAVPYDGKPTFLHVGASLPDGPQPQYRDRPFGRGETIPEENCLSTIFRCAWQIYPQGTQSSARVAPAALLQSGNWSPQSYAKKDCKTVTKPLDIILLPLSN